MCNFLHSLFSQCNVTLNGVTITQMNEHYNYRSYLDSHDLRHRCGSLASLKRVLISRHERHAALRPYDRDSERYDEPGFPHLLERTYRE